MRRHADRLHGIRILFEDEAVIVIEKPAGLLTQATRRGEVRSVAGILTDYVRKGQLRSRRQVYLVHRLDRETSGVMMVAKTAAVQDHFRAHWNEVTEKTYLARVTGALGADAGFFESYLAEDADGYRVRSVADAAKGRLARTEWRVESADGDTTLVRVTLKSGRKNQIRVHFAEAGHPVVGDAKYARGSVPRKGPAPRLALHAWRLAFIHPETGRRHFFETARPDFAVLPAKGERPCSSS